MSFLSKFNPFRKATPAASPVAESPIAESPVVIGPVASPSASDARCDSEGFYQHLGECWNDSIQMTFLFSDGFKEIVQPALLDPNFDSKVESIINDENNKQLFLFKSDLVGLKIKNITELNNPFENNSSKAILASKVRERKNAIIEYFKVLKKRFMRHYNNESIRRESCDLKSDREHSVFQTMSEISRAAGKDGIAAAALGHKNTEGVNRSHINVEELRKKKAEKQYSPGGNINDEQYLFNLYKLVFFANYEFEYTIFDDYRVISVNNGLENTVFLDDLYLMKDLIQKSKAVYISSDINYYEINEATKEKKKKNKGGHATAFYTCGNSEIYYEDNSGIYQFPWKEFLLKLVNLYKNDKTTTFIFGNNTQTGNLVEIQSSTFYPIIRTGSEKLNEELDQRYRNQILEKLKEIKEMKKISSNNNKQEIETAKYLLNAYINRKEELSSKSFTYYTFINNSPLLESKDGHFEYNGISISVPDEEVRSLYTLIFMTINNNQSVNTQRFNNTARHGDINWDYFTKIIEQFDLHRSQLDAEKILQILNEYIQSNNFKHYKFFKENLSYEIGKAITKVIPPNPELNNRLLELAATHLDATDVEELRKKIPKVWIDKFGKIDDKYLDTLIAARDSEGILKVFTEFLNSNNFESKHRSNILFISIESIFHKFIPVNLELNQKLFELIKDDLGINKEMVQMVQKQLENQKTNQVLEGGYRKRKTRYQKRLIKRKTQKKRRLRR